MPTQLTTHRLRCSGAEVQYDVRGSGPVLLVIGQPMTADPFAPVADLLAAERTVVTYDPRGMGRSTVDDPSADVTPEAEADDLAEIIETFGGGPVDVFGSSGGAVAGLALVARRPELVRTLVAHEPPLIELVPDAPHVRAAVDGVLETFRTAGAGAAWGGFVSLVMHDGPIGEDGVRPATWPPRDAGAAPVDGSQEAAPGPSPEQAAADELFFLHMLTPFTRWHPPVDALREHGGVVIALGRDSGHELARRSTDALAELLGTVPVLVPGDHGGFMAQPGEFADALRSVLQRGR